MNIVFTITARMTSSRLPGKSLKEILGKPLLGWLVDRIKPSRYLNNIVVATTINEQDNAIVDYCQKQRVNFFRGSENDVLGRVYGAAKQYRADAVLRCGPDCPFIDSKIVDQVCRQFIEQDADYGCTFVKPTFPWGIDFDMYTFNLLKKLNSGIKEAYDREHMSPYILRYKEHFNVADVRSSRDLSGYRLTVDYPEDLEMARAVFEHFNGRNFTYLGAVAFLNKHPEVRGLNSHHVRVLKVQVGDKDKVKFA